MTEKAAKYTPKVTGEVASKWRSLPVTISPPLMRRLTAAKLQDPSSNIQRSSKL